MRQLVLQRPDLACALALSALSTTSTTAVIRPSLLPNVLTMVMQARAVTSAHRARRASPAYALALPPLPTWAQLAAPISRTTTITAVRDHPGHFFTLCWQEALALCARMERPVSLAAVLVLLASSATTLTAVSRPWCQRQCGVICDAGSCGSLCNQGKTCQSGVCACPSATPDLGSAGCTNFNTDGNNCGDHYCIR